MLSLLDGNRTRNTPTEIIVLLYFRNSYEVGFLFWFIDRQRNEVTCCTGSFFRAEDPITCATMVFVFLAYCNEVHFIVAQLVNKSIAL